MLKENITVSPYTLHSIGGNVFLVSGFPFVYLSDIKSLVFGDIHFGQETAIGLLDKSDKSSYPILAEHLLNIISVIAEKVEIHKLILNGDIKHETNGSNGQEIQSLKYFLNDPRIKSFEIVLVKGNHDKYLELSIRHLDRSNITLQEVFCSPPYCIFHGHENHDQDSCEFIIVSHEHPAYNFTGNNYEKMRTMAFVLLRSKRDKQILILPPANFISSGVIYPIRDNKKFLSPFLQKEANLSFQHIFPFSDDVGLLLLPPYTSNNR
ncbi:MAG: hypothetical protein GPJ54_18965 [Candidatus Heimdallarchaeota archaeon]|nr:hypothetical protein [Candidatus Heimdallarchaeota archaeon]